jgi:hypothetical protein
VGKKKLAPKKSAISRSSPKRKSKKETKMYPDLNSYHVVLSNGSERDVKADQLSIENGVLTFSRSDGELVVAYAEGSWVAVELERRDDKGYPGDDTEESESEKPEPKR